MSRKREKEAGNSPLNQNGPRSRKNEGLYSSCLHKRPPVREEQLESAVLGGSWLPGLRFSAA
ncbi:MAG TPA: hypothetical protein VND22_03070, partial [Actinomycetota bacterium]|nr:hypothetical protein [Actinomycetota bacterium]